MRACDSLAAALLLVFVPQLANLDPLRLFDELTTRLGEWLLDIFPRMTALLRSLTSLPAGHQVVIVIGGLMVLGLGLAFMRKAFGEASAIRRGAREAQQRNRQARADLAISDRRRAWGYVLMTVVFLIGVVLLIFVYQSILQAVPEPTDGASRP